MKPLRSCKLACDIDQMTHERRVLRRKVLHLIHRLFGHHENMRGRRRSDIAKCDTLLVFMDDVRRKLTVDDLLEDGFLSHDAFIWHVAS